MTSPSIVRKAFPQERDSLWALLRLMYDENGIFSLSEHKVNWMMDRVLCPESIPEGDYNARGFMGVIGKPGIPEGLILLVLCPASWYSEDIILQDCANFVHPDHRKSDHAKALLAYGRHISDEVGIPYMAGVVSNVRTAAKVRLYRRQMPEAGAFFLYNMGEN